MPVHIANPEVVAKINRLTHLTGLGKTAVIALAVDRMLADPEIGGDADADPWPGIDRLVAQLDRLADRPALFDPVEWDEAGLPR